MASRGKTVAGTDGTDHKYRETIASQYVVSAKLKGNLQTMFHVLTIPLGLIAFHVLELNDKIKVTNQVLPRPEKWEYLYLLSGIFNLIGRSALSRNNSSRLAVYFYGSSITAFSAILWSACIHAHEVEALFMRGTVRAYLFGQPLVIVIYLMLTVFTQMNIFALNYARRLMKAWKLKGH